MPSHPHAFERQHWASFHVGCAHCTVLRLLKTRQAVQGYKSSRACPSITDTGYAALSQLSHQAHVTHMRHPTVESREIPNLDRPRSPAHTHRQGTRTASMRLNGATPLRLCHSLASLLQIKQHMRATGRWKRPVSSAATAVAVHQEKSKGICIKSHQRKLAVPSFKLHPSLRK